MHIVLAEQNEMVSDILTLLLVQRGFKVTILTPPFAKLPIPCDSPPDFIVCDVGSDDRWQGDFCCGLLGVYPLCKPIFISGSIERDRVEIGDGQTIPVLHKPFWLPKLLDELLPAEGQPHDSQIAIGAREASIGVLRHELNSVAMIINGFADLMCDPGANDSILIQLGEQILKMSRSGLSSETLLLIAKYTEETILHSQPDKSARRLLEQLIRSAYKGVELLDELAQLEARNASWQSGSNRSSVAGGRLTTRA